jgi:hypothetical protein
VRVIIIFIAADDRANLISVEALAFCRLFAGLLAGRICGVRAGLWKASVGFPGFNLAIRFDPLVKNQRTRAVGPGIWFGKRGNFSNPPMQASSVQPACWPKLFQSLGL